MTGKGLTVITAREFQATSFGTLLDWLYVPMTVHSVEAPVKASAFRLRSLRRKIARRAQMTARAVQRAQCGARWGWLAYRRW